MHALALDLQVTPRGVAIATIETASATQVRDWPVNAFKTADPTSRSRTRDSRHSGQSSSSTRQLAVSPRSPPTCAKSVVPLRPIPVAARTREASPSPARRELDEEIGRRHPLDLHAVLRTLVAEKGLVDERLVREVPGMRVHFVEVAETGKRSAALGREAAGSDVVRKTPPRPISSSPAIAAESCAAKYGSTLAANVQLGFAEAKLRSPGPISPPVGMKPAHGPIRGTSRRVGVAAGEHHEIAGIEARCALPRWNCGGRGRRRPWWPQLSNPRFERRDPCVVIDFKVCDSARRAATSSLRVCRSRAMRRSQRP